MLSKNPSVWAWIAKTLWRLVACWKVPGSNHCMGEIFLTIPNRPWGTQSLLYNGCRDVPGSKAAGP
jgi:hypothetical protein